MLNVPDEVKALFKRDGVRKNFRVHFPNGELPDITNENIVQESVKFTESLCSQDVLKFGLTEASVIEFETVGIGNMYGMTIECGIEIDLSSLTAAQLNDIASGTWDGVYTDLASSDIGYAYFRVPYGIFRIESCPRDHQAMAHRKVKAYSVGGENATNPFETTKCNLMLGYDYSGYGTERTLYYNARVKPLVMSNLHWSKSGELEELGYTKESVSMERFVHPTSKNYYYFSKPVTFKKIGGGSASGYIDVRGKFTCHNASIAQGAYVWKTYITDKQTSLYSFELPQSTYDLEQSIKSQADALIEANEIDLEAMGFSSSLDLIRSAIGELYKPGLMLSMQKDNETDASTIPNIYPSPNRFEGAGAYIPFENSNYALYVYRPNTFAVFYSPTAIRFYKQNVPSNDINLPEASVYKYTDNSGDLFQTLGLSINSTLKSTIYIPTSGLTYLCASFANAYSITSILNGYLELNAMFGKVSRFGSFTVSQLSNSSPVLVLTGEYSEFWWDEYDVLPIGSVKYSYKDSNNEQQVLVYSFGDGASIYDMSDNDILASASNLNVSTINAILESIFIPYLSPINFTPIDMTMKGLPYMEAGDYLAVTAEDGMIANSFNMKMEISGIQVLTANIESTSGDIIESGESA